MTALIITLAWLGCVLLAYFLGVEVGRYDEDRDG